MNNKNAGTNALKANGNNKTASPAGPGNVNNRAGNNKINRANNLGNRANGNKVNNVNKVNNGN